MKLRETITWGRVSYVLYFVGTALVLGSWLGVVTGRIGWMGWIIAMIGWAIPHYIHWHTKRRRRSTSD
jgi:hypothetical protein